MPANSAIEDPKEDPPIGLISLNDIATIVTLPILLAISWLLPTYRWYGVCRFIAGASPIFKSYHWAPRARMVETWGLGSKHIPQGSERSLAAEVMAFEIERVLMMLRLHRPFKRWCKVKLVGGEHIDTALNLGKGVILWDSHFVWASTGTKIALCRSGYKIHHLSSIYHGYSSTAFGINALNPIWVSAEMKALAERVVVAYADPKPALQVLQNRLEENAMISIVVASEASRVVTTPFYAGTLALAPGAPVLAAKTGAQLLPVFTVRDENGDIVTTVEAPIDLSPYHDNRQAVQAAVEAYADRLKPWLERYPVQWLSWEESVAFLGGS